MQQKTHLLRCFHAWKDAKDFLKANKEIVHMALTPIIELEPQKKRGKRGKDIKEYLDCINLKDENNRDKMLNFHEYKIDTNIRKLEYRKIEMIIYRDRIWRKRKKN